MANRAAFTHKPKITKKDVRVFIHPTATKALWDDVWAKAKASDWWEDCVAMVLDNKNGTFYFQITGLTTGWAAVDANPDLVADAVRRFN